MSTIYQLVRPAKVRLTIYQGATFRHQFKFLLGDDPFPFLEGYGLSDWSARMEIREYVESDTCLLRLDTDGDGIELFADGTDSGWNLYISAEDSATLPAGNLVYDLELVRASDGFVLRVQEGVARVVPEVTRGGCDE
jgi:hypothetical protein